MSRGEVWKDGLRVREGCLGSPSRVSSVRCGYLSGAEYSHSCHGDGEAVTSVYEPLSVESWVIVLEQAREPRHHRELFTCREQALLSVGGAE